MLLPQSKRTIQRAINVSAQFDGATNVPWGEAERALRRQKFRATKISNSDAYRLRP